MTAQDFFEFFLEYFVHKKYAHGLNAYDRYKFRLFW